MLFERVVDLIEIHIFCSNHFFEKWNIFQKIFKKPQFKRYFSTFPKSSIDCAIML